MNEYFEKKPEKAIRVENEKDEVVVKILSTLENFEFHLRFEILREVINSTISRKNDYVNAKEIDIETELKRLHSIKNLSL